MYSVTLDTAASSSACRKEFPSSLECTITQDGCTMAFACNPDPGFDRANLDANQRATFSAPGPAGSTGECSAQFHLDGGRASLDWECTFTAPAGSATCKGNGSGRGS